MKERELFYHDCKELECRVISASKDEPCWHCKTTKWKRYKIVKKEVRTWKILRN